MIEALALLFFISFLIPVFIPILLINFVGLRSINIDLRLSGGDEIGAELRSLNRIEAGEKSDRYQNEIGWEPD